MTGSFTDHGLPFLAIAIMLESFGLPLPGEATLIAFAVLAAEGHYDIRWVIAAAGVGAIVGDNLGYWLIGRLGGRALLARWQWLSKHADRVLPRAERLIERHGGTTVFFGRFVSVLRYTVAWVAGLAAMNWWKFLFWNAAGGVVWSTTIALVAYYLGHTATDAIQRGGAFAALSLVLVAALAWTSLHVGGRRLLRRF